MRDSARWLHAHDPTRIVGVDVWGSHPPSNAGALYADVDAVAETDYTGWYEDPHGSPAQLAAEDARAPGGGCSARSPAKCS